MICILNGKGYVYKRNYNLDLVLHTFIMYLIGIVYFTTIVSFGTTHSSYYITYYIDKYRGIIENAILKLHKVVTSATVKTSWTMSFYSSVCYLIFTLH